MMTHPPSDSLAGQEPQPPDQAQVTQLLRDAQSEPGGNAAKQLFPLVYDRLKELARRRMSDERADHTLQPTALVHEAYLRLVGAGEPISWEGRSHFYFAAAEAMRRILIDYARGRAASKRGGKGQRVPLSNVLELAASADEQIPQILSLDEALSR